MSTPGGNLILMVVDAMDAIKNNQDRISVNANAIIEIATEFHRMEKQIEAIVPRLSGLSVAIDEILEEL